MSYLQIVKYLITSIIIYALYINACYAQLKSGNLTHYTEQDGLPGGQVNSILADNFGYLWVGTINGLARFDGHEFKRFYNNPNDSTSIKGLIVWSMYEDKQGQVWISTSPENLNVYNPVNKSFRNYSYKNLIDHIDNVEIGIASMCEDHKDRIYLGIQSLYNLHVVNGLLYYDKKEDKIKRFVVPDSIEINNVLKIASDGSDNVWLISLKGLYKINKDRELSEIRVLNNELAKNLDYITALTVGKDGHIWITTLKTTIINLDPVSEKYIIYSPLPSLKTRKNELIFTCIAQDKSNNFWIGTNMGLQYFDQDRARLEILNDSNTSINQSTIIDLKVDSFGSLWIGTYSQGLFKYEKRALFKSYSYDKYRQNSLTPGWANNIIEGKDGKLWITCSGAGFESGINELDLTTGKIRSWPIKNMKLKVDLVSALMETKPGEFYFSTIGGLYKFYSQSGELKKTTIEGVPDSIFIRHFYVDKRENLWLGTIGGLFRKNKGENLFRKYDLSKLKDCNASSNEITKVYESQKHGLWLLTNNGLFLYDYETDKIERHGYDKNRGDIFVTQDVNSFYEDSQGIAWVGTWEGGLSRYDTETKKIKTYTRNDGLPSMSIQGILANESKKVLWLSTFEGLSIFDMQTEQFNNFSIADGIQGQLFADGAYLKTLDGQFVFGGSNGITVFKSNDINNNSIPPNVFLTDLKVFNKSVTPGEGSILKEPIYATKEITLEHNQNNISIEFMTIHYSNPSKNKSAYMLENYDNEWRQADNQHVAYYSMLPPGEYLFHVKGANNNGVWNEQGASLKIIIHPPWWKTKGAYLFYLLFFILLIFVANRYFRDRLIQQERERSRIKELVQAREIEKAYTELKATQSQLIQAEKMASLGELTAGIAHEIQNPLNFVNNFSEVNTELIEEMKQELNKGNLDEVKLIAEDIADNEKKIAQHGKRADSIVKGMLLHSRRSSGMKEPTDINALADEYLRLTYHGLRAKDKSFNAILKSDFDPSIGKINVTPQEMGRVIMNLLSNAFYAVNEKRKLNMDGYEPTVSISTQKLDDKVEIRVSDNGLGIPQSLLDKIYQPFFTTKPSGEGTGLGLSLSYEIVTKGHGGELKVDTREGEYTTFIIDLPI